MPLTDDRSHAMNEWEMVKRAVELLDTVDYGHDGASILEMLDAAAAAKPALATLRERYEGACVWRLTDSGESYTPDCGGLPVTKRAETLEEEFGPHCMDCGKPIVEANQSITNTAKKIAEDAADTSDYIKAVEKTVADSVEAMEKSVVKASDETA